MERKVSKVINSNIYFSCVVFSWDFINFVYLVKLSVKILEFFVLLIIGRNNPKMYSKIIRRETTSIALTPFIFIIYFSFKRGNNSTKLHGLWLISNWYFNIPSHASVTPPDDPGRANIYLPLDKTAQARDCIADVPIVL